MDNIFQYIFDFIIYIFNFQFTEFQIKNIQKMRLIEIFL